MVDSRLICIVFRKADDSKITIIIDQLSDLSRKKILCESPRSLVLSKYFHIVKGYLSVATSKLNFHIWNANSFARAKSEAKMAAHGGKFWTSVSFLFVVLYVSSSPLHNFNFKFLFGST